MGYWIGLNSLHSYWSGTYLWSDETPVDYTNWDNAEPNGPVSNLVVFNERIIKICYRRK